MNDLVIDPNKRKTAVWLWLLVASGVMALLATNAHLLYVATASQPACVSHVRQGDLRDAPGLYGAAKSSCSPTTSASAKGDGR